MGKCPVSVKWFNTVRWEVINFRARGLCEICNVQTANEVHHLRYPVGRREQARDLVAVCDDCHRGIHLADGDFVGANDNFEQDEFDLAS
jgi:hypothetical protein